MPLQLLIFIAQLIHQPNIGQVEITLFPALRFQGENIYFCSFLHSKPSLFSLLYSPRVRLDKNLFYVNFTHVSNQTAISRTTHIYSSSGPTEIIEVINPQKLFNNKGQAHQEKENIKPMFFKGSRFPPVPFHLSCSWDSLYWSQNLLSFRLTWDCGATCKSQNI